MNGCQSKKFVAALPKKAMAVKCVRRSAVALCAAAVFALVAVAARGADINFTNTVGGVLTEVGNWSVGAVPSPSDTSQFNKSYTGPVTMTDAIPALTNNIINIYNNSLEFALGNGHEFVAKTRVSLTQAGMTTISSGTFGSASTSSPTIYLPNTGTVTLKPVSIIVDGENSVLRGPVQLGAKGPAGSTITVRNGAKYEGSSLSIGVQSATASNNVMMVTDAGSRIVVDTLNLGQTAGGNTLVVSNSATMQVSTMKIGTIYSGTATSTNNALIITKGGRATIVGTVKPKIGEKSGSHSNRVEVLSGGMFDMGGNGVVLGDGNCDFAAMIANGGSIVSSNSTSTTTFMIGNLGRYARLDLDGGAVFSASNLCLVAGNTLDAVGASVRIAGGSRMTIANDSSQYHYYSHTAPDTAFDVDGGEFTSPGDRFRGGLNASASNSCVKVRNGGILDVGAMYIGDHAERHDLIVENGTIAATSLSFANSHTEGTDKDLRHDRFIVRGTNSSVTVSGDCLFKRDTALVFEMPREGYRTLPLCCEAGINLGDRSTVSFVADVDYEEGGRIVLMRSTNKIVDNGATFLTNVGSFDNNDFEIAVRLPSKRGLKIIFR